MKFHKPSKKDKFRQACMKNFSRITSQDFQIVSNERFAEILRTQPSVCC